VIGWIIAGLGMAWYGAKERSDSSQYRWKDHYVWG
jgi:hypothetical protein